MTGKNKMSYRIPDSVMEVVKEASATAVRLAKRREQIDTQYKSDFTAIMTEMQATEMKARNAVCNALGIDQIEGHVYIIDDAYLANFGLAFLWDAWDNEAVPEPTSKPATAKLN